VLVPLSVQLVEMKRIELVPGSWVYTEPMNDIGSDEIISEIRKERGKKEHKEPPLVVMAIDDRPGLFAIAFGNHRALLAEWEKRPMEALVVESEDDFALAEQEHATLWGELPGGVAADSTHARYERARVEILEAANTQLRRRTGGNRS